MKKLAAIVGLLTAVAFGVAGVAWSQYQGFLGAEVTPPSGPVSLTVKPGTSLGTLARELADAGIIHDVQVPGVGSLFYLWAHKVKRAGSSLKAGEYLFEGPATPDEVLSTIVEGRVRTYQVTIPEGLRLDEVMPLFEAAGLGDADALLSLARDPAFAHSLGIAGDSLEGFVFPDTYTYAKGLSAKALLAATVERFEDAWAAAEKVRQPGITLTKTEAVTLASIIEKETGQPVERPRIGCVFHNRLKDAWKLQTDPTVIYAKLLRNGGVWDGNITKTDLTTPHPYNTYTIKGLPPGPIASPGQAALEAALNPEDCRYYFFVSKNDGSHIFCDTLDCHNRAVEKWQVRYHKKNKSQGG